MASILWPLRSVLAGIACQPWKGCLDHPFSSQYGSVILWQWGSSNGDNNKWLTMRKPLRRRIVYDSSPGATSDGGKKMHSCCVRIVIFRPNTMFYLIIYTAIYGVCSYWNFGDCICLVMPDVRIIKNMISLKNIYTHLSHHLNHISES